MTFLRLCFAVLLMATAWHYFSTRPVHHAAGILVENNPEQSNSLAVAPFAVGDYQVTPLATFTVRARVLRVEKYYVGREADLSPIDVALGWGVMSDTTAIDKLNISQGNRFYFYSWSDDPPLPVADIVEHSANMHLIPSSTYIKKKLNHIRVGHIVEFSGYLVRADASDGWSWTSSLTRADSGAGACEVVWVNSVSIQ